MPKDTSEFPLDGVVVIGPIEAPDTLEPSHKPAPTGTTEGCEAAARTPVRKSATPPKLLRILPSPLAVIVFALKVSFVGFVTMFVLLLVFFTRGFPNKDALLNYQPNLTTHIYSQSGQILDEFATYRRIYTPIEDIPDIVQQAFISAEDKNFYTHPGFDTRAIAIAGYEAIRTLGARTRGASTITQQMLKNVVLRDQPRLERKLNELLLATRTEALIGKDKVLEIYLNEIFLGQKSYGITAAAQTYFNKPLDGLSIREAAILAAFAKSPSTLHPVRNHDRLLARRDYILEEMYENGYISKDIYDFEHAQPIETVQDRSLPAYAASLPPRSYFSDGIRRQLSDTLGRDTVFTGGLNATATVNAPLQAAAEKALRRGLERYDRRQGLWRPTGYVIDPEDLQDEGRWRTALARTNIARDINLHGQWLPAVVLSLGRRNARIGIEGIDETPEGQWIQHRHVVWKRRQNADGTLGRWANRASHLLSVGDVIHVRAIADGRGKFERWSLRQVPELQGGFMAMEVDTGRVIAMQGGFSYQHSQFNRATQAQRQPGSTFKPVVYAAALNHGYDATTSVLDGAIEIQTAQGVWRPRNAGRTTIGHAPMRRGLEQSRNLMTVRLAQDVGLDAIASLAEDLRIYDQMAPHFANALGAQETTLSQMVSAYATIANGGRLVTPTLVDQVVDRAGASIVQDTPQAAQVIDPVTAYQLTTMMRGVVDRGTARRTVSLPVPTAGKTGTTNQSKDVWFIGFTSNLVAGCYMGFDTPRSLGWGADGGSFCGPVFNEFMTQAVQSYGGEEFAIPDGGFFIKANRYSGNRLSRSAKGSNVVTEFIRN